MTGATSIRNVRPAFFFLLIDLRENFEILSVGVGVGEIEIKIKN